MSYNCDMFKVKKIENLEFKEDAFKDCQREIKPDLTTVFSYCEAWVSGIVVDGSFLCEELECTGEGSGEFIDEILEPALKDSTGILVASCVWEGGDSINHLICKDGKIEYLLR